MLLEERLDQVKVENILEHLKVVLSGVDNLDLKLATLLCANFAQIDVGNVGDFVGCEGLGGFVNLVRDALRGGCTIGKVILDTEVFGGAWTVSVPGSKASKVHRLLLTTRVVAGSQ